MSVQAPTSRPFEPSAGTGAPAFPGCTGYGSGSKRTGPAVPLDGTGLSALSKEEMGGIAAAPAIAVPLGGSMNLSPASVVAPYIPGPSGGRSGSYVAPPSNFPPVSGGSYVAPPAASGRTGSYVAPPASICGQSGSYTAPPVGIGGRSGSYVAPAVGIGGGSAMPVVPPGWSAGARASGGGVGFEQPYVASAVLPVQPAAPPVSQSKPTKLGRKPLADERVMHGESLVTPSGVAAIPIDIARLNPLPAQPKNPVSRGEVVAASRPISREELAAGGFLVSPEEQRARAAAEAQRLEAERAAAMARAQAERAAAEQRAAAERMAAEQLAAQRAAAEQRIAAEHRATADRAMAERLAAEERAAADRLAAERAAAEAAAAEQAVRRMAEQERARLAAEREAEEEQARWAAAQQPMPQPLETAAERHAALVAAAAAAALSASRRDQDVVQQGHAPLSDYIPMAEVVERRGQQYGPLQTDEFLTSGRPIAPPSATANVTQDQIRDSMLGGPPLPVSSSGAAWPTNFETSALGGNPYDSYPPEPPDMGNPYDSYQPEAMGSVAVLGDAAAMAHSAGRMEQPTMNLGGGMGMGLGMRPSADRTNYLTDYQMEQMNGPVGTACFSDGPEPFVGIGTRPQPEASERFSAGPERGSPFNPFSSSSAGGIGTMVVGVRYDDDGFPIED